MAIENPMVVDSIWHWQEEKLRQAQKEIEQESKERLQENIQKALNDIDDLRADLRDLEKENYSLTGSALLKMAVRYLTLAETAIEDSFDHVEVA